MCEACYRMNLHYLMQSLSPTLTVRNKIRIIYSTVADLKLASSESAFILPVLCFRVMSNSTFIHCTCTVLVHVSASGRPSCSGEGGLVCGTLDIASRGMFPVLAFEFPFQYHVTDRQTSVPVLCIG
jgi:hypothetical protein